MVFDPFGQPCDLDGAAALAREHDLLLIEYVACALGAHVDGRRCGSWPGAACFSFHPRKIIMHVHPAFAACGYQAGDLPQSHRVQQQSLTLPLWPGMPAADIARVVAALDSALAERG